MAIRYLVLALLDICVFVAAHEIASRVSPLAAHLFVCAALLGYDLFDWKFPSNPEKHKQLMDRFDKSRLLRAILIPPLFVDMLIWILAIFNFCPGFMLHVLVRLVTRFAWRSYRKEKKRSLGEEVKEILLSHIGYRTGVSTSLEPANLDRFLNARPDPEKAKRVKQYLRIAADEPEAYEAHQGSGASAKRSAT